MKLRNQLLALACLLLFIAFGFLYFYKWVEQKPFGIIIFVCDELTVSNITASRMYEGGADHRLNLETLPNMALLTNYSNDFAIPDDASSASTLATGQKVNNRSIAMDPAGKALASLLEIAREKGRSTGLVTTGNLTDPGVAAFYAHAGNPDDVEGLAAQLADNTKINVVLGGGARAFTPESKGGGGLRKDGRDLTFEMRPKRQLVRSKAELENTSSFLMSNIVGIFSNDALAYSNSIESGNQQPSLTDMVRRSIEFLQYNASGYVLVVDSSLGSRAARQNDGEHVINETLALDRALKVAREYAGENTLIIVVGRHSTGGMVLNGYPLRQDHGVGLLGTNSFGYPAITWATGPNGPVPAPIVEAVQEPTDKKQQGPKTEPAAFYIREGGVSNAEDVVAAGVGPGSQVLKGFLDNTIIFKIVKDNL